MIRLVTVRRLQALAAELLTARAQRDQALLQLELVRQAGDHAKVEAAKWERRACVFIDQIGIESGKLTSPAMSEPTAPPEHEIRGLMRSLNQSELQRPNTSSAPPSESVPLIGVNEVAARSALAGVLP